MNGRKFNQAVFERNDGKKKNRKSYTNAYEFWEDSDALKLTNIRLSFFFFFFFLSKQSMKMLQCLS